MKEEDLIETIWTKVLDNKYLGKHRFLGKGNNDI